MFTAGHKFGNHNNHWKGGRLTKEQYESLRELVPKSIAVWAKILEMPVDVKKGKGLGVQADVAAKVLMKFAPDLTAELSKEEVEEYDARFQQFITNRIRSNGGLQVITPKVANQSNTGGV